MIIEDYEFGAFLKAFQDAVLDGYRLNLEKNETYPQKFGSHMRVQLEANLPVNAPSILPTSVVIESDAAQNNSKVSKRK